MGYIEKNLRHDEEILIRAKFSFLGLIGSIVFCAIFVVLGVLVMSYVPQLLEEKVSVTASFLDTLKSICLYLGLFFIVVGVLKLVVDTFKLFSFKLAVTNKRVIGKMGSLFLRSVDLPIEKIDSCMVSAGFWGKIFRFYNFRVVSTNGQVDVASSKKEAFKCMKNANEVKNCIIDAIEKHADDARKAQAAEIAAAMSQKNN